MTDDGLRRDAEIHPQSRECIFDREERGLQVRRFVQLPRVLVVGRLRVAREHLFQINAARCGLLLPVAIFRPEDFADVAAKVCAQNFRAAIHLRTEGGECRVKFAPHPDVVIADSGQQQHERAFHAAVCVRDGHARGLCRKRCDGSRPIHRSDEAAVRHRATARLQSERRVVQIHVWVRFKKCAEIFRVCGKRRFGAG